MRRTAAVLLGFTGTVATIGCRFGGDASRPNLSGTWVLDPTRSSLEVGAPDSSIFVIDHVGPSLTAERTHVLGGVADTVRVQVTADSALKVLRVGGLDISTRVYWDADALVLDQEWTRGSVRVTNLVRYTLEDEGQTLIADERMRAGPDAHHNLWTFRRRPSEPAGRMNTSRP